MDTQNSLVKETFSISEIRSRMERETELKRRKICNANFIFPVIFVELPRGSIVDRTDQPRLYKVYLSTTIYSAFVSVIKNNGKWNRVTILDTYRNGVVCVDSTRTIS